MSREIKTRQVHKSVKALDKAVTGMERVKQSYVRTKESAERINRQERERVTPTEYAEDHVMEGTDTAARKTVQQVRKQGGKLADTVKEKHRISKEAKEITQTVREGSNPLHGEPSASSPPSSLSGREERYQPKEQIIKKAQEQAGRQAAQKRAMQRVSQQRAAQIRELPKQTIKTIDRGEKSIRTAERASQTVKSTRKGTVKSVTKSVKTVEHTAGKAIKTTQEAARNAKAAAKVSVKTAEKTV